MLDLPGDLWQRMSLISHLQNEADRQPAQTRDIIYDAKRFILSNRAIIERAPLQTYSSALVFSPLNSEIRTAFADHIPQWIKTVPRVLDNWDSALQVLEGHTLGVNCVVFSFNSELLASGSWDRTVRLWEASTGNLRVVLDGHTKKVNSLAFSADGRILASGSDDATVRLWDPSTGESLAVLSGHTGKVWSVAVSSDSKLLASIGEGRRNLYFSDDKIKNSAYVIRLWDLATREPLRFLVGHNAFVTSLAFSPHKNLLASGSADCTVRLWDVSDYDSHRVLEGHSGQINFVVFSPDGRLLASASDDGTVRIWDPASGERLRVLENHSDEIASVAFSADPTLLVSTSSDGTLELWDLSMGDACGGARSAGLDGISSLRWPGHRDASFSANGKLFAFGCPDGNVRIRETPTGGLLAFPLFECIPDVPETHQVFSADGKMLASARVNDVVLRDAITGDFLRVLKGHSDSVTSVEFSPRSDTKLVASGSLDHTIRLWDPLTGDMRHVLRGHSGCVSGICFSGDGKFLASWSWSFEFTVRVWDPSTGELYRIIESKEGVRHAVFSSDSSVVAITDLGSFDCKIRIWEMSTGMIRRDFLVGTRKVIFSPDNSLFVAMGESSIELWDLETGQRIEKLKMCSNPLRNNYELNFSSCGTKLFNRTAVYHLQSQTAIISPGPNPYPKLPLINDWLTIEGQHLLWLPPAYRPKETASQHNRVYLGRNDKRQPIVIEIDPQAAPDCRYPQWPINSVVVA